MMSKNIILTVVLILILMTVLFTIVQNAINGNRSGGNLLLSPILQKLTKQKALPSEPPSNIAAPKTFKFDRSTDLEAELESINPLVLDSDFE